MGCSLFACQVFAAGNQQAGREAGAPYENFYRGVDQRQLQHLLNIAAVKNDVLTIMELCEAGADPNAPGYEGYTPMQLSLQAGTTEALQALLEHGGKPDGAIMMAAAKTGQLKAMKLLERYGGNIAQTGDEGCSTLHYMAEAGTLEMVQYLVERGVPINATCRGEETPLDWAKNGKNGRVIRYLERMGARSSREKRVP